MRTCICFVLLAFSAQILLAQDGLEKHIDQYYYDSDKLSADFHRSRRELLRDRLPDSSFALFFSNPIRNRSNDVNYEYHQDPNFYYLTGLEEPHSLVIVFKDSVLIDSIKTDELIFVQPRDAAMELWNGKRLGEEGVKKALKFNVAKPNISFADFKLNLAEFKNVFSVFPSDDIRDNDTDRGDLFSLVRHSKRMFKTLITPENTFYANEVMGRLRAIKHQDEIALMINAIDHTCEAQRELMGQLKPGMSEYEAEAVIEYVFKKNGSEHPGFPSILGGGENSCTLHYITNRRTLKDGDLLVSDVGAEYHNYTADVTRTLPVSGRFTEDQKLIYNIVYKAQEEGIKASVAGNKFWDPGKVAKDVIIQGLLELKIIEEPAEYRQYFMHGTSHYLGLDVHDAGPFENLENGNVITVEPGIYIAEGSPCDSKWWNIGVRIEDDVLINDATPIVLSNCVPKTIVEIETIMSEQKR